MANLNKVLLMGNLTRAPQAKAVQQTGMPVCDMGLAVNRRYKTQSGEEREDVTYVDLTAYGHLADYCAKNMTKGTTIYVEGHLRFETWQDKDTGKNRSRLRVVVDNLLNLDRKGLPGLDQQAYPASGYGQPQPPYPAPLYGQPMPNYGYPQQPPSYPPVQQPYQPLQQQPYQPLQQTQPRPSAPPQQAALQQTAPQQTAPQQAAPQQAAPQQTAQPQQSAQPQQAAQLDQPQQPSIPPPTTPDQPTQMPPPPQAADPEEVADDLPF